MTAATTLTDSVTAELLERANALKPLLASNAAQVDLERRLPEENLRSLTEAGLFKLTVPRRFGGYELPIESYMQIVGVVAEACGSTAWVTTLINVCNWTVGLFSDRAQQEVFGADPEARVCGVLAPSAEATRVDGGVRVSGRWGYASGCLHSSWALLGIPPAESETGEHSDQATVLIPMSELRIEDTWYVAGMRGTGSNTIVAENVFVPSQRIMSVVAALGGEYPTEHKDEALYRSALVPVLALVLAGPQVGMARGVFDLVVEKASRRAIAYTVFEHQTDSTTFQTEVSDAAMLIDTAAMHVSRAARDIDGAAAAGEKLPYVARARVRADTGWAIRSARKAIDTLISANGASSFAEVSAIQRLWRDSSTAGRHAIVLPSVNQEVYGKALLGLPPQQNITPLI